MKRSTLSRFRPIALASSAVLAATLIAACGSGNAAQSSSASSESGGASAEAATVVALDDATTADEARAALLKSGVLSIGIEGTYPPFNYHDASTSELKGYDVDVIKAVAQRIGVEPKFSEVKWDGLLAGLDAGHYDVVANQVAVTPERQKIYEFSSPYTVSTAVVIVPSGDNSIRTLADVAGKTSAQSVTSNWAQQATDAGATVVPVDGFAEAVSAIRDGRVNLTFNDNLAALDYFKTTGDDSVKVAFEVEDLSSDRAAVVRKGDTGLAALLSQTIDQLQADGTLAQIGTSYFGRDISK